jgi:hypothetical protein
MTKNQFIYDHGKFEYDQIMKEFNKKGYTKTIQELGHINNDYSNDAINLLQKQYSLWINGKNYRVNLDDLITILYNHDFDFREVYGHTDYMASKVKFIDEMSNLKYTRQMNKVYDSELSGERNIVIYK